MASLAVFEPRLYDPMFLTISTTKGLSLAMTICTEEFKVVETIVVVDPIFMLELKHDFLYVP